jgi:hypothetical protein
MLAPPSWQLPPTDTFRSLYPDTTNLSGFPASQSSIAGSDPSSNGTTEYSEAGRGRTFLTTQDHRDLQAFLRPGDTISPLEHPSASASESTSMPSLTTPIPSPQSSSTYIPTSADEIEALTLSAGPDPPPISFASNPVPSETSSFGPRSGSAPPTAPGITHVPASPLDRVAYTRHHFPARVPIRVYFLSHQFSRRQGLRGVITRWRLPIEEAYSGAFPEFGISIMPGHYVFEDLGNPLCLIGRTSTSEGILFTFPLRHSPVWGEQNIPDVGSPLSIPRPCYLPLTLSRPPRVGGFLHPHCYGVPGHLDTCKWSLQPFYRVLHTFEGDGTLICSSWAAAHYRGRSASHFSRGGQITMKGFPT